MNSTVEIKMQEKEFRVKWVLKFPENIFILVWPNIIVEGPS
jgi:hypothetical protein